LLGAIGLSTPTAGKPETSLGVPEVIRSAYGIDSIFIGRKLHGGDALAEYECKPSEQFIDFTWCQRIREGKGTSANPTLVTSILHKEGFVGYVSRYIKPAFFVANSVEAELERFSKRFNEKARVVWMPKKDDLPKAVIASWGKVQLEPLKESEISALAAGRSIRAGFLVDFLGNFQKSAQLGLNIYRLASQAGFVWVASFDETGRGHLRFLAVDASLIAQTSSGPQVSPQPSNTTVLITETTDYETRKHLLDQLAAQLIKAKPTFRDYVVKKTDVASLPGDTPVLRVVFDERVFFNTDHWDIRPDALAVLDVVAQALQKEPAGTALFVAGHTDSRASVPYNQKLSVRRANSVADALVRRGTGAVNIWSVGFGKSIPLRPNDSPINMSFNRRVEFILASKVDALKFWFDNPAKFLCADGTDLLPHFCKDPAPVQSFTAIPISPPAPNHLRLPERPRITITPAPPKPVDLNLPPPPIVDTGRPQQ
jgi:outer membrane protein OmpA-like peptidoglycan-associated protein